MIDRIYPLPVLLCQRAGLFCGRNALWLNEMECSAAAAVHSCESERVAVIVSCNKKKKKVASHKKTTQHFFCTYLL